jgi:hypothetical protein
VPRSFLLRRKGHPNRNRKHRQGSEEPQKNIRSTTPESGDPEEGIRQAKRRVQDWVPTILDSLREKAEEGSCAHAKFLFEFAGIEPGAEKNAAEDSLSAILLERLDEMQRDWREQHGSDFPPYGEATGRKVE